MLLQGMVGYGCRHSVAVFVSGSVEIQRDTHVGLQSGGKLFVDDPLGFAVRSLIPRQPRRCRRKCRFIVTFRHPQPWNPVRRSF